MQNLNGSSNKNFDSLLQSIEKETITRCQEDKENWTPVRNSLSQDKRLSYRTRGILIDLLSRPKDWEVTTKGLEQLSDKDGREGIRNSLKEAVKFGYILKIPTLRNEKGQATSGRMHVYSVPQFEEPLSDDDVSYLFSTTPVCPEEFKKFFQRRIAVPGKPTQHSKEYKEKSFSKKSMQACQKKVDPDIPKPVKNAAASFQEEKKQTSFQQQPKKSKTSKEPMPEKSKQAFLDIGFPPEALDSLHDYNRYSEEQYLLAASHLRGRVNLKSVGIIKYCIDKKCYAEPRKETAQDCNRSSVLNDLPDGGACVQGNLGKYEIYAANKELEFNCRSCGDVAIFSYNEPNFKDKVRKFIEKAGLINPLKQNNLLVSFT